MMLALGSFVLFTALAQTTPDVRPVAWEDFVDEIVRDEALSRGVPGVALTVVHDSKVLVLRAYGRADVERRRALTAATPFNIASVSKPFTSTVVLHLASEGRIDLDAQARRYLAWLPERYSEITIRQLMTHTSGIVRDVRRDNQDDPDEKEYRERICGAEASAAAGSRWEYSNTGFTVLGWAAEAAAGAPLAELLRREIFEPAGMLQAEYRTTIESDRERARPYEVFEGKARRVNGISGGFGSGGISMSIADFAMFAVALQRGDVLSDRDRELAWKAATLADGSTAKPGVYGPNDAYGCGWFLSQVNGHRLVAHGGGIDGFSATLEHFPDDHLTIVVLANVKARDDGRAPVESIASRLAAYFLEPDRCPEIVSSPSFQAAREIEIANTAFSAACVAGDAARIADAYSASAIAMKPDGRVRVGSHDIAAMFALPVTSSSPMRHRLYCERLRLFGDFAVEQGTCYSDAGVGTEGESGRYLVSWAREDGRWRMVADSWTEPPP